VRHNPNSAGAASIISTGIGTTIGMSWYRFWHEIAWVCEQEVHLAQLLDDMYGR